jgi:group I intron endonuclease
MIIVNLDQDNLLSNIGVYQIRNLVDGKRYIGSTFKSFKSRLRRHRTELRKNFHNNKFLQNAWNKHGESNFVFEILYVCNSKDAVRKLEQSLLNSEDFKLLYNLCKQVDNPSSKPVSEETKHKQSLAKCGNKNWFFGKNHSSETKAIISEKAKARNWNPMKGNKHSVESRQKISETRKRNYSKENHPFYGKTGAEASNTVAVVDIITGQEFGTIKEAAEFYGYNKITLSQWLSGRYVNKSNLRYK